MFSQEDLNQLLGFIGYGRLDAPIWFIGMEEGGGGEANLRTRLQFEPIMDLGRAQRLLGYGQYFDLPHPRIQPTWRVLIQITLGILGAPAQSEKIAVYQSEELGSTNGDTLLTELMPLPAPTTGTWPYKDLFSDSRFASRDSYLKSVKPGRIQLLQDLISHHQPRLAICYGKSYWADYQRLFPAMRIQQTELRSESGRYRSAPVDKIAYGRTPFGGLAFLMAHPVAHGMNAEWRLHALVRLIRSAIEREVKRT